LRKERFGAVTEWLQAAVLKNTSVESGLFATIADFSMYRRLTKEIERRIATCAAYRQLPWSLQPKAVDGGVITGGRRG
jgi:Trm5-related predicted tRNA methylase